MKAAYVRVMDALYVLCMAVAGFALAATTLFICWSVFSRYVLNEGAYWPEPLSVLLIVLLTFLGGAACYRAGVHIAVTMFLLGLEARQRRRVAALVELVMAAFSLFLVVYGGQLVAATWNQVHPEFVWVQVGLTYLPIPVGSFITLLFILEKVWVGPPDPGGIIGSEPDERPDIAPLA